ncbi:MAG: hypothetical protein AB7S44_00135 [Spirochaetales bacterium]
MLEKNKIINKITLSLTENKIENDYYSNIDGIIRQSLQDLAHKHQINGDTLNCFMAGDHVLGTNLTNSSPLIMFVSYKADRATINAYEKAQKMSKRAKSLMGSLQNNLITDKKIAHLLFETLTTYFDDKTKLFVDDNIVIINDGYLKIKVIVGYNFNGQFSYNYLGYYYEENFLKTIEAFDQKDAETNGGFYHLARLFKSMEISLMEIGALKSKIFDKLNFIEHLLYNVPSDLIKLNGEDFGASFYKALSYLKNCNLNDFKEAGSNEPMFNKETYATPYSLIKAKYFIKAIEYFYNNFEKF